MIDLDRIVSPAGLATAMDAGHVVRKTHPELPLSIYSYSRSCQYAQAWDAVTTRCRGLVVDEVSGTVVAHCLPKFFNVGEHGHGRPYAPPLPDEPFEVYDKVDGSLGIVFHYEGRWRVASRGSFTSEQATWASAWLDGRDTAKLRPGVTYLAEILYPQNRIVVDYGGRRDLVLLAAYDAMGREIELSRAAADWAAVGSVARTWPAMALADLLKRTEGNAHADGREATGTDAEGYVIRYASGLRVKAKISEYVRLHKVLTGITERDIWRFLGIRRFAGRDLRQVAQALGCGPGEIAELTADGADPLEALLQQVPDEFDAWVRSVVARLDAQAAERAGTAAEGFGELAHLAEDRGAFARGAQRIADRTVRAAVFQLLDGRDIDLMIWRSVKPTAADPFTNDEES
ncbi:T4 RnlA family RNA ligase [Streptomyces sp. ASQP_92]|uniref:T4 RnlA family RNA ligase n=1 Tax=Streptomyces sp. ASQP_92 TaxID=2979116 RepID=UPI0021C00777|nr:T4 RnlA family RNA ligase [Streptomyces sp. ASQP_92]MCT9088622.1 T4 RnlA family RNA ligase [Streptomyces sp. ASQP_92]